jgi:hypothetical protein
MTPAERRELMELWLIAGDGGADSSQMARLNHWIETDAAARAYILSVAGQQGWLAWHASEMRLPEAFEAIPDQQIPSPPLVNSDSLRRPTEPPAPRQRSTGRTMARWTWAAVAASLVGFVVGQLAPRLGGDVEEGRAPHIQATMVSSTGCVWGPGVTTGSSAHRDLVGGDGLQLLEGIAEFRIGLDSSDVRLQLEGPASVVLTGQGAISLRYGKIIVTTGDLSERYPIETSFGRVLIEPNAQTGLVSFGSTEEIHSFRGEAKVESPWLTASDLEGGAVVKVGEALHFKETKDGALEAVHGVVQPWRFTLQVPMTHDFLAVGPDYVREITDSHPVAYWRFEGLQDGVVRNEVADRFHGRIKGQVGWVGPEGNQAIEFGITPEPGSLVVAESWGDLLGGDFSLEAWIKPSHYHLGSIVGFIGEFDWQDRRNKHGLLLEVNGASTGDNRPLQRLRFLHRPVLGVTGGVSLHSDRSYQPRRWQHVAAVRDGDELRLYLDGELVQQATTAERLPRGLQLVMGQLYTETVERFFIGHVDEIAIYDRPLSEKEIRRRHELLRPSKGDDDHLL